MRRQDENALGCHVEPCHERNKATIRINTAACRPDFPVASGPLNAKLREPR